MHELVSIIIPAFNVQNYIGAAVNSCIDQTYPNLEVIIVDDGSVDNTYDELMKFVKCDPRIRVFRKENGGVSSARNLGLMNVTGDYVLFLDSDDWLEINAVEELLHYSTSPELLTICDRKWITKFADGSESIVYPKLAKDSLVTVSREEALSCFLSGRFSVPSACYKLFSSKIIRDNNLLFDESIAHGEDGLFVYEYLYHTNGFIYIPERLWDILERPGSATRAGFSQKMLSMLDAIDKMLSYGPVNSEVALSLNKYFIKRSIALISTIAKEESDYFEYLSEVRNRMSQKIKKIGKLRTSTRLKYIYYLNAPVKLIGVSASVLHLSKRVIKGILYK